MPNKKPEFQSLSLLSGKGGSGKTVIALSMCKVLKEAGLKVLLVDCDIATHGATYFFESELEPKKGSIISISQLLRGEPLRGAPLLTKAGFYFIPSTLRAAEIEDNSISDPALNIRNKLSNLDNFLANRTMDYNAVIFDCQAGYSPLTKWVAKVSKRNLIVLETDAVSSTALRVLFLQIGPKLQRYNTWQVFNKLSEEERAIYEKVSGGILFPNLPPIPFDWQVKASFATCAIPSVMSKGSAFGLGVLRLMQTVFPKSSEPLRALENKTVGEWFEDTTNRLIALEKSKQSIMYDKIGSARRRRWVRTQYMTILSMLIAAVVGVGGYLGTVGYIRFFRGTYLWPLAGLAIATIAVFLRFLTLKDIEAEHQQDIDQQKITELDAEIERFKTLIATDPRLREYSRERNAKAHTR